MNKRENQMESKVFFQKIKEAYTPDRTIIIGIDGLGGAGKSTISEALKHFLEEEKCPVTILHIDDFIHTKAIRYNDDYAEWECYYYLQWRYDYLVNEVIQPLRGGDFCKKIELYDKENDTYYLSEIYIPSGSIVVIEGVFLQRKELRDMFDCMAYIDVPEEIRLNRVLKRDGYIGDAEQIERKYRERYFPAEHHYLKTCLPNSNADYIVCV